MYQFYYHRYGQWNHFFKDLPYIRSKQVCYHHKQHMTVPALVHRFLIPHIPSTRYLHHCRVVVSQRCHRIASFLRLALIQISSTLYTKIKKRCTSNSDIRNAPFPGCLYILQSIVQWTILRPLPCPDPRQTVFPEHWKRNILFPHPHISSNKAIFPALASHNCGSRLYGRHNSAYNSFLQGSQPYGNLIFRGKCFFFRSMAFFVKQRKIFPEPLLWKIKFIIHKAVPVVPGKSKECAGLTVFCFAQTAAVLAFHSGGMFRFFTKHVSSTDSIPGICSTCLESSPW